MKDEVDPSLSKRGYDPAILESVRQSAKHNAVTSLRIRFRKHLSRFKYPYMSQILVMHESFEKGILPFPGSLSEQPAQILEIFNLLTALKNERTIREHGRRQV